MNSIYYYKLTVDDGGAPCVEKGLLSLAICKPRIRSGAKKGDWIFGFAASQLESDNRLIYIAKVTGKEIDGLYYRKQDYSGRLDRIYRRNGERYERRAQAFFHDRNGDLAYDLGVPPKYPRAQVLLSRNFRYLGAQGTAAYKKKYKRVRRAVERLARGERVNHPEQLRAELMSLQASIWQEFRRKVCGTPHQPPNRTACHRTRSCGVIN